MEALLVILGLIAVGIGGIWILVEAFRESILWGLGCLFINILSFVFVAMHWETTKKPFLIYIGGIGLIIVGVLMSDGTSTAM
jgi:hypothetical protein